MTDHHSTASEVELDNLGRGIALYRERLLETESGWWYGNMLTESLADAASPWQGCVREGCEHKPGGWCRNCMGIKA